MRMKIYTSFPADRQKRKQSSSYITKTIEENPFRNSQHNSYPLQFHQRATPRRTPRRPPRPHSTPPPHLFLLPPIGRDIHSPAHLLPQKHRFSLRCAPTRSRSRQTLILPPPHKKRSTFRSSPPSPLSSQSYPSVLFSGLLLASVWYIS